MDRTGTAGGIESRTSWSVAAGSFLIIAIGWGSPYVVVVALKAIAADFGGNRELPSLVYALAYIGSGVGGIFMGIWADRVGALWTALLGSLMIGSGALVASYGTVWALFLGYGVMIGLLGNAGIFAPLMANTSRWFDAKRGTALALVASGQQIAGAAWPPIFRYSLDAIGWRQTLFWYGVFSLATMVPLCILLRHRPPMPSLAAVSTPEYGSGRVLGMSSLAALAVICAAIVCCCVAMSMPMSHLVAFCSDLGFAQARGAEMLSLLLGSAFLSRMIWGRLSDRIGGLKTILIGSALQAAFLSLYLVVDNLAELYVLSAAFGLGFGGIIPSYVLTVRALFPAHGAGWRIATVLLFGLLGMALGAWLGGYVYDLFASYHPAFAAGVAFNIGNLILIGSLLLRGRGPRLARRLAEAD